MNWTCVQYVLSAASPATLQSIMENSLEWVGYTELGSSLKTRDQNFIGQWQLVSSHLLKLMLSHLFKNHNQKVNITEIIISRHQLSLRFFYQSNAFWLNHLCLVPGMQLNAIFCFLTKHGHYQWNITRPLNILFQL